MVKKTANDVYELLQNELPDLKSQLTSLKIEVTAAKQVSEDAKEISEQNNRALRGSNNNPGLVADVSGLCTSQNKMSERIQEIEVCLHKGAEGVPGLVDQVRENREWRKSLKYWYIVFIGAILVGVINITLELGSRYFLPPIP